MVFLWNSEVIMKKCISIAIAMITMCGSSSGMLTNLDRKMEVRLDTQANMAIINNRTQSPIPYEIKSGQIISFVIPMVEHTSAEAEEALNSLLLSLNSDVYGIKPSMDFIISEDAITKFNDNLFPRLGSIVFNIFYKCQEVQQKSLIQEIINCNNFVVWNYLELLAKIPESDVETFSQRKTSIESYFSNALQKIEILTSMLSPGIINKNEQYKQVSLALIKSGEKLYDQSFREHANIKQKHIIEEYDEDCKKRVAELADLAKHRSITLSSEECYTIAESLNSDSSTKNFLLQEFYNSGWSSIMQHYDVFEFPNLSININILQKVMADIEFFKQDIANTVYYIAALYCLSNLDNLRFFLGVYDSYSNEEAELRQLMQKSAKNILSNFFLMK